MKIKPSISKVFKKLNNIQKVLGSDLQSVQKKKYSYVSGHLFYIEVDCAVGIADDLTKLKHVLRGFR